MAFGRPPIYDPSFCERVAEYGRAGMSRTEIACELNVSRETVYAWMREHRDFSDAMTRAKQEELAFWEREGRTNLKDTNFNASLWSKNMSGRFRNEGWGDKMELTGDGGGPVKVSLTDAIAARNARLGHEEDEE